MSLGLSQLNAMTSTLYSALGESVTYTPTVGDASTINVILFRDSQLFGQAISANYADGANSARIKKADVTLPVRGDTITDSASAVYTVEDVDDSFNESEHEVQIRRTA